MVGWGRGAAQWGLGPTACSSIAAAGFLSSFAPKVAKCPFRCTTVVILLYFSLFTKVFIDVDMNVNVLTHSSRAVKIPVTDKPARYFIKPKGKILITKEDFSINRVGE